MSSNASVLHFFLQCTSCPMVDQDRIWHSLSARGMLVGVTMVLISVRIWSNSDLSMRGWVLVMWYHFWNFILKRVFRSTMPQWLHFQVRIFLLIHFVFVISSAIWFCDESRNEEMHNCLIEEGRRMIVIGTFWWNWWRVGVRHQAYFLGAHRIH